MVRNYKRKTDHGKTALDIIERAVTAVLAGGKVATIAKEFGIPRMTLTRYVVKHSNGNRAIHSYDVVRKNKMILSSEMEKDLANHVKLLANMFHGLSVTKCRELAYEFAKHNEITMPSSWMKNEKAGWDWWLGFRSRHKLSIRSPEATSFARATAFNRPVVDKFYDNLATLMDRHAFQPSQIYNVDETGCTTVQTPKAVVAATGQIQVGSITSGERGTLVTVVYAISAIGNVVPPMFIFPRVNYKDHFINGAPPGSLGKATQSGWINEDLFIEYLKHFIHHVRCSETNKVLLILDNHDSHISLQAIDLAKENGIVMLTLPPHTSHRLQPLDRSVYGPFKTAFNRAMDGWLRSNPGRTVTIYEIPQLVNEAHMAAITPANSMSGFKSTGIYPYNRQIFTELDFAAAQTTDQPMSDVNVAQNADEQGGSSIDMQIENVCNNSNYISPSAILPVPKAQPRKKNVNGRKKGSTKILTDTPVRDEIASSSKPSKRKDPKPKNVRKKKLFNKCTTRSDSDSDSEFGINDIDDYLL